MIILIAGVSNRTKNEIEKLITKNNDGIKYMKTKIRSGIKSI